MQHRKRGTFSPANGSLFPPPSGVCSKCRSFHHIPQTSSQYLCHCGGHVIKLEDITAPYCPVDIGSKTGKLIKIGKEVTHSYHLAMTAERIRSGDITPMRGLLELTSNAEKCIHFLTFSIDTITGSALWQASGTVPIYGVVTRASEYVTSSIKRFLQSSSNFNVKLLNTDQGHHIKLIIIDGIVAISGSMNLTMSGLDKAANDDELLHIETNVDEVIRLNNEYFARKWSEWEHVDGVQHLSQLPVIR